MLAANGVMEILASCWMPRDRIALIEPAADKMVLWGAIADLGNPAATSRAVLPLKRDWRTTGGDALDPVTGDAPVFLAADWAC